MRLVPILLLLIALICSLHANADPQLDEALLAAIRANDLQGAASLIEKGANVNSRNPLGFTTLMFAGNAEMTALLLKNGASPNDENPNIGENAIIWQSSLGNMETVALLVDAGANLESVGRGGFPGMTPVMRACENRKYATATYLTNKGANVNHVDPNGNTPLILCIRSSIGVSKTKRISGVTQENPHYHAEMAAALDAIKAMVAHGAKTDTRIANSYFGGKPVTPLGVAIDYNRAEIIKYLKELNAPEN